MKIDEKFLNECLDKIIKKENVFSAVLRVESGDGSFVWTGARGEMKVNNRYFIASVTKLYATAVVLVLIEEGKLRLDDKIATYLPDSLMENLHVLNGIDYSNEIKIGHLLSNTSGLPDYFFHKEKGKASSADLLLKGQDVKWDLEKTIEYVKKMTPKFPPGKKDKADYSDTNYQLLGKIIETVTGKNIKNLFQELIFEKLNLRHTYVFEDINDQTPVLFYYKEQKLWLPQYMQSISVEGGIVSTAEEVMIFLKAFFNGEFFPKEKISELKTWNFVFKPGIFYFGMGLERVPSPRILTGFKKIDEIIGFWGQTSAFAWYNPDTDLYFTGTCNQVNGAGHQAAMNTILKIIKSAL